MALVALVLILAAAVGLIVANRPKTPTLAEEKAVEEKREAIQDLCASRDTFPGLKKLIFDQASRLRPGERVDFDVRPASAFPRSHNLVEMVKSVGGERGG